MQAGPGRLWNGRSEWALYKQGVQFKGITDALYAGTLIFLLQRHDQPGRAGANPSSDGHASASMSYANSATVLRFHIALGAIEPLDQWV